MESRCCLMHRLKKAVRASLVLLSLLFYVFGLHVHYVNRTVTAIGALKGRSKITWGHKILSFKQCGVVDTPHCFEAS